MDPEPTFAQLLEQLQGNRRRAGDVGNRFAFPEDRPAPTTMGGNILAAYADGPRRMTRMFENNALHRTAGRGDIPEALTEARRLAHTVAPMRELHETDGLKRDLSILKALTPDKHRPSGRELMESVRGNLNRAYDSVHSFDNPAEYPYLHGERNRELLFERNAWRRFLRGGMEGEYDEMANEARKMARNTSPTGDIREQREVLADVRGGPGFLAALMELFQGPR